MKDNVTIQDLANALGMSRNTVSKAINGKPVPAKTRNAVISAAIEMGYKGFKLAAAAGEYGGGLTQKRFLLLSTKLLLNIDYHIYVLRGIEEVMEDHNAELVQFTVSNTASFHKLRNYLDTSRVDGIICLEFFDLSQIAELTETRIPIVFLDFPYSPLPVRGHYDILLPESRDSVKYFCTQLIREQGCTTFGFVGDRHHCRSFYERYAGMMEALLAADLPMDQQYCLMHADNRKYSPEILAKALGELPALPDCFVAANDSIAISLMKALRSRGARIPQDVKIIGFDNIPEAKTADPPLTTFNVNKTTLGRQIIDVLMDRSNRPAMPNTVIHIASKLITREST